MAFSFLRNWLARRRIPRLDSLHVVLYTRRDCHLCELAWEGLRKEQRHYRFQLTVVDVDADPKLVALYGSQVPVVTVDGKLRFRGTLNKVLLARLLRKEARRS
jgi:hypothetical protein